MLYCPVCAQRNQAHTRIGVVVECPLLRSPRYYVVTNEQGTTAAVIVGPDLLATSVGLFEPALAKELGFKVPDSEGSP